MNGYKISTAPGLPSESRSSQHNETGETMRATVEARRVESRKGSRLLRPLVWGGGIEALKLRCCGPWTARGLDVNDTSE